MGEKIVEQVSMVITAPPPLQPRLLFFFFFFFFFYRKVRILRKECTINQHCSTLGGDSVVELSLVMSSSVCVCVCGGGGGVGSLFCIVT